MSGHAGQLAELTGLDDETVEQQILPYLATFTTRQALVNHLQDLVGPGPAQTSFIQSFAEEHFPPALTPRAATQSLEPIPSASIASYTPTKATPGRKTKTKFPSKLPPPRKVDAASFGGAGSVYRKGQDEGSLFATVPSTAGSSGKVSPAFVPTPSRTESRTPEIPPNAAPQDMSSPQISEVVTDIPAKATTDQDFVLIPTDEMRGLQQSIALLRGDSKEDPTFKAKPCFCQGRKHTLHPHVPLCLSCGLIFCSILSPSPLLLPSPPCPSCAAPILSTTSRAILLTQLDLTLTSLTQAHEDKVRLIREERQQAWKEKRKEVDLFPELHQQLGGSSSPVSVQAGSGMLGQAYNIFHERRRNIDIAMGRKVQDDSQRRSRVLRIESKTAKGKGSSIKKKKKPLIGKEGSSKPSESSGATTVVAEAKGGVDSDQVEEDEAEDEEEAGLDYDLDEQGDGPVADPDDDGFAQHSSAFPLDNIFDASSGDGWKRQDGFLPTVSYIFEKDRTVDAVDEEEVDEEGVTKRQIPGSAPKELNVIQSNLHDTGIGKKAAKPES